MALLPLTALRHNPLNPKRPMGSRYLRGLRASLSRFGFAGLFVVAGPDPDGTYEVLDGNTRLDELDAKGAQSVPCVVLDLDDQSRREFVLAHDRHRKVFDEDQVAAQLKDLAGKGRDLKALADLSGQENLRQLVEQQRATALARPEAKAKAPATMSSLVLYGPSEDVQAVKELAKRIKGRQSTVEKVRQVLEQCERHQDLTDEQWVLALSSALARTLEGDG